MLSILLDQILKNSKARSTLIRLSFFTFQGYLASILLNDGIRLLYGELPGKPLLQYGIAGVIATAPFVHDKLTILGEKSNNVSMGAGLVLGTFLSNISETKDEEKKEEAKKKQ